MAKKRRKLTTPEEEAAIDARTREIQEFLRQVNERVEAYRRAQAEKRARRERWLRLLRFRRAA